MVRVNVQHGHAYFGNAYNIQYTECVLEIMLQNSVT